MSKNIVICCDGTGNEVEGNLSNVLKLFRIAQKNAGQRVYYSPGIGTIGSQDQWTRLKQNSKAVFGLATGYGLDADILGAYRFISEQFEDDDSIFLFGFSRGAYTVRALAGFIHMVGLLPPDQLNVANYALTRTSGQAKITTSALPGISVGSLVAVELRLNTSASGTRLPRYSCQGAIVLSRRC